MVETIDVTDIKENDDGTSTVTFDMSEEMVNEFIRQGMEVSLKDIGSDYVVVPPAAWEAWREHNNTVEPRKYELSEQEATGFFQIGTLYAIKKGLGMVTDDE